MAELGKAESYYDRWIFCMQEEIQRVICETVRKVGYLICNESKGLLANKNIMADLINSRNNNAEDSWKR